jgi:hypothetical protein
MIGTSAGRVHGVVITMILLDLFLPVLLDSFRRLKYGNVGLVNGG